MKNDKNKASDTRNNIAQHTAQPTLRHRLLQAVDKLAVQPGPAEKQTVLLKIMVAILAGQLVISLVQAGN